MEVLSREYLATNIDGFALPDLAERLGSCGGGRVSRGGQGRRLGLFSRGGQGRRHGLPASC